MKRLTLTCLMLFILVAAPAPCQGVDGAEIEGVSKGMPVEDFLKVYPKVIARTYRTAGDETWMTYNHLADNGDAGTVTFHLKDGKIAGWAVNDREEVVTEYLSEYCSQSFILYSPKIYSGIKNALMKIPWDVFLSVTDRSRPVLFSEYHYTGTGRFANSSEIVKFEDDAPSMMDGVTIIKLSTELETTHEPQAIEAIIAHEIAHRYLEHSRKKEDTCQMEREANRTIIKWGFDKQFEKAKAVFGSKPGESNCRDEEEKELQQDNED